MPGLMRGLARGAVIGGSAAAVGGRVRRRQDQKYAAQDATAQQEQQATYQQAPPPAPAADPISQLKDLAALKEQGILTEEEFATQKARILAQ